MKKKIFKYIIGGGLAAILDLILLYIFVEIGHIYYIYGTILSFCISFLFGFLFQKYITFSNNDKKFLSQGSLFLLFQLVGLGLNILLLYILVDKFGFYYMYIAIINKCIVFIWNFLMNNYFNFK